MQLWIKISLASRVDVATHNGRDNRDLVQAGLWWRSLLKAIADIA